MTGKQGRNTGKPGAPGWQPTTAGATAPTSQPAAPAPPATGATQRTSPTDTYTKFKKATAEKPRVLSVVDLGSVGQASCAHCGMAIRYACVMEYPDGRRENWGSNCAGLTPSAYRERLSQQEREAFLRGEAVKWEQFRREHPDVYDTLERYPNYFARVPGGRFLYPDEIDKVIEKAATVPALDAEIRREEERKAASQHVGVVGDKITTDVTIIEFYVVNGHYGSSVHVNVEDADGNRYDTYTNAKWVNEVDEGDTITLTGTIKAHVVHDGYKTTRLSGPKRPRTQPTR